MIINADISVPPISAHQCGILLLLLYRIYIAPTVYAALYNIKGRQNSYNTIKYKRIKRALLRRAYNLIGWGRWYKRL